MNKFGKQLLAGWIFSISVILFCNLAFASPDDYTPPAKEAPAWVQKPVQCASPEAVFDRIESDGLLPLFSSTGNARVENEMYALPYGFFYNPENSHWLFVEFFSPTSACVIGVGEGVDFDVQGDETKSSH
tara:strand:- start:250 stop:639 length:390 start_codon:yes stop_codon:yes gene_type:complete